MDKKEQAINYLEQLDIYKPYINAFKTKRQRVCFFENFGGFYDDQEPEIEAKRKEIERTYDCVCYAITHDFIEGDEMYSFLLSTNNGNDIEKTFGKTFSCFAYVWNKSYDYDSELGYVSVRAFGGGLRREF